MARIANPAGCGKNYRKRGKLALVYNKFYVPYVDIHGFSLDMLLVFL
jgi:hypothetical protein